MHPGGPPCSPGAFRGRCERLRHNQEVAQMKLTGQNIPDIYHLLILQQATVQHCIQFFSKTSDAFVRTITFTFKISSPQPTTSQFVYVARSIASRHITVTIAYSSNTKMQYDNPLVQMDHNVLAESCPWQVDKPRRLSRERLPAEDGLQWGSDPSFCYHGFSSPIGTWTEERLVQNLMRNMASICTSLDIDFDTSESSSSLPSTIPKKDYSDPLGLNGFTLPMFQPSTVPTNERLSETPSLSSSPSQGQAPSPENTTCTRRASCIKQENKSGQKKRKCVQKSGQKLCHCRSEKKRREIIGERYRDLCQIVPGLEKHSYTRKYVLEEAAFWIQSLLQGNDALKRQLEELKEQEHMNRLRLFPVEEEEEDQKLSH